MSLAWTPLQPRRPIRRSKEGLVARRLVLISPPPVSPVRFLDSLPHVNSPFLAPSQGSSPSAAAVERAILKLEEEQADLDFRVAYATQHLDLVNLELERQRKRLPASPLPRARARLAASAPLPFTLIYLTKLGLRSTRGSLNVDTSSTSFVSFCILLLRK